MRPPILFLISTMILATINLSSVHATNVYVSPTGKDTNAGTQTLPWRTIQKACDSAVAGTTIIAAAGTYNEKVIFNRSGTATGGYITLQGAPGAVMSGSNKVGDHLIYLYNKSYIRITGFELRDNLGVTDGSAIRVEGAGNHLEFLNNKISRILGKNAMGITVYGSNGSSAISDLVIDGNEIYDCQPAPSEALTLNGNVAGFQISNNYVHNVNNIGIDMIGGEKTCPVVANDAARQGVCRDNRVLGAHSPDEGGYASGIYIDGGRDIIVERNLASQCDVGLSVGAENKGTVTQNITVRDNLIYKNDKRGLSFGGYDAARGRVTNCRFFSNTCWQNDTLDTGDGELHIEYASGNFVKNNIFVAGAPNLLLTVVPNGSDNTLDNNLYYANSGAQTAQFVWRDIAYIGFESYRSASKKDAASIFVYPRFKNTGASDFSLGYASPAVNAGDRSMRAASGETDFAAKPRFWDNRIDIGAFESPNHAPVNKGISPSTGTSTVGTARNITATWGDADGAADIKEVRFLVSATLGLRQAIYGLYIPQTNKIYLSNDSANDWVTGSGVTPGSKVAPLQNSQVSLDIANMKVTQSGNLLSIVWPLTPKSSFVGSKNLYLMVRDLSGAIDNWEDFGDWTIAASAMDSSSNGF